MLDLSQYAGARKRRELQMVEFWRPDSKEALRRSLLIYAGREVNKAPPTGDDAIPGALSGGAGLGSGGFAGGFAGPALKLAISRA